VPTDVDQADPAAADPSPDPDAGPDTPGPDTHGPHAEPIPGPDADEPDTSWEAGWPVDLPAGATTGLRGALRSTPPGLGRGWRRALVGLLAVQLVAIAVLGVVVAFHFPVFSPADEEAHFSYVQQIAQHGSLPVLGRSPTSPQGLEIFEGTYPRPPTRTYSLKELSGLDYEALQPPLYYVAAVPAFDLTPNYVHKVYSIRMFDVLLMLASLALVGRLARVVLGARWMVGWAFALVFFAVPGVVLRMVTVSNLPLAVPLAILFATELWIGWERHSGRRLTLAGLYLGLAVLTQLEQLFLIPVFALVLVAEGAHRWRAKPVRAPGVARTTGAPLRKVLAPLAVAAVLPVLLVAPWFLFNESNYHMLTAGPIAIAEQTPAVNPHHLHFSLRNLPDDTVSELGDPTLPEEWGGALGALPFLNELELLLSALIIPASLVITAGLGRRLRSVPVAILGLPFVVNVLELWYIHIGEQWFVTVRYLYTSLPILMVLAAGAALCVVRPRFLPVLVSALATAGALGLWAYFLWAYHGYWAFT